MVFILLALSLLILIGQLSNVGRKESWNQTIFMNNIGPQKGPKSTAAIRAETKQLIAMLRDYDRVDIDDLMDKAADKLEELCEEIS